MLLSYKTSNIERLISNLRNTYFGGHMLSQTLDPLIEILAFYAATRNYSYIDRLANALDEVTAYEAVRDSLRDFYSQCIDREDKCVEVSENLKIICPDVDLGLLEKSVNEFLKRIGGKSGDIIVKETRELALAALARKPKIMERRC